MTPESNSARYFAVLYAAAAERPVLEALLGIEREVFDSVHPGLDHHVAHSRLQWWREECERAARGSAVHPLTRAVIAALGVPQAKSVPQLAGLCGIVDVATWDLASATFETRRELDAYCERWAAAMIEPLVAAAESAVPQDAKASTPSTLTAPTNPTRTPAMAGGPALVAGPGVAGGSTAVGSADSAALLAAAKRTAAWHDLGAAICEVELLQALATDAHDGRIRFPLDELERANVDANSLAGPPWPQALASSLKSRLGSLRADIEHSVTGLSREQQETSRGLLVWASISWRTAKRVEGALPNRPQPGRLDGLSDAWFAWRIARRATVGRFKLN